MSAYDRLLETMSGKHVTVIGIGVSNTPLISLLLEAGAHVTVHDRKTTEELGENYIPQEKLTEITEVELFMS